MNVINRASIIFKEGQSVDFDYSITHYVIIDDTIAVRVSIPSGEPNFDQNIYCYNSKGQLLWQINYDKYTKGFAYVALDKKEGKYLATNFQGKQMLIEPKSGKTLKE
ncbi:MAG: hypothetical protein AAGA77_24175, partial [Bacteroidota bacterium]